LAEKTRMVGVSIFGVILGAVELVIASFLISMATYVNMMIAEITRTLSFPPPASYLNSILGTLGSLMMFAGIYVLFHSVKRIIDHGLMAYIAGQRKE